MLDSLSSAVSGLDAFQQQMDVIGNNIANINTTGFKTSESDFGEAFSNTLQAATAATTGVSDGTNSMQLGTGVATIGINNNWGTGVINPTPNQPLNLAIQGSGFFQVTDPTTQTQYVTQDGQFSLDQNGNLVTATGQQVQGYNTSALAGGATGAIQINATGAPSTSSPTATMTGYSINEQGVITVDLSDGTSFQRGQLLLQSFNDPQALLAAGNNLYTNMTVAGPIAAPGTIAGSNGTGTIQSNALEGSNVDLSSEMANLITAQRGFEANSKMVTTSDEVLQDLVNMKH